MKWLISEHFEYVSHRPYALVVIVLQSMMNHDFLPQQFMTHIFVPILKNKCVEECLWTTENQVANKKSYSTLKDSARYYMGPNTAMYVCFLDCSRAFDCIDHWKLFKILVDRKCPTYVIKLLAITYKFPVCNGVKQGGILSPKLFNIYVDVSNEQLNNVMMGCYLNVINYMYYAYDLVLLSPSAHGMEKLYK